MTAILIASNLLFIIVAICLCSVYVNEIRANNRLLDKCKEMEKDCKALSEQNLDLHSNLTKLTERYQQLNGRYERLCVEFNQNMAESEQTEIKIRNLSSMHDHQREARQTLEKSINSLPAAKAKISKVWRQKKCSVYLNTITIREFNTEDSDYNRLLAEELCDKLNETLNP